MNGFKISDIDQLILALVLRFEIVLVLQSNQVKRTPQEFINEFIIQKLNPLLEGREGGYQIPVPSLNLAQIPVPRLIFAKIPVKRITSVTHSL